MRFEHPLTFFTVTLTQNYLKGILSLCLAPVDNPAGPFEERGILIHCISGWDRTPLFVSLLRISLWADGVIHKSLSAIELLFFTVATDWMLFGHNLNKRVGQAAELMFYCFYLLTFIKSDEYSIDFAAGNPVNPTRGEKLEELSQLGLEYYSAVAAPK
jgi:myotubularin-related protein 14